ncbi:MAG TPA: OmpA family protein [Flavobacteriaceae bacterium]|nr:OmpA family protein [Flavobacteriaceae bacterium]
MRKLALLSVAVLTLFTSCVSNKKFDELKVKKDDLENELYKANAKLDECKGNRDMAQNEVGHLKSQIKTLERTNEALTGASGDFATISKKAAENLERSLESIREKDKQLRTLRDAVNKRDSVTLALVTSLKGALGNLQDEDIEVNVEKGVVFVSISDKLLFGSGSYQVTQRAREVLGKVATVVNDKPDIEFMVEGHTDSDPVKSGIAVMKDNWDLSTLRANAVVRILQNDYNVDPARMTSAGRSEYVPVASNATEAGKAKNRRTRIVVLPKLDRFYDMIEKGMEQAKKNSQ